LEAIRASATQQGELSQKEGQAFADVSRDDAFADSASAFAGDRADLNRLKTAVLNQAALKDRQAGVDFTSNPQRFSEEGAARLAPFFNQLGKGNELKFAEDLFAQRRGERLDPTLKLSTGATGQVATSLGNQPGPGELAQAGNVGIGAGGQTTADKAGGAANVLSSGLVNFLPTLNAERRNDQLFGALSRQLGNQANR